MPLLANAAATNQFAGLLAQQQGRPVQQPDPQALPAPQMPHMPQLQPVQTPGLLQGGAGQRAEQARQGAGLARQAGLIPTGEEGDTVRRSGEGSGGVRGTLGDIFTGAPDPMLSDDQNRGIRRRALGAVGLGAAAALTGGASVFGAALAGGVLGRGTAQEERDRAVERTLIKQQAEQEEARQRAISDLFAGNNVFDPEARQNVVQGLFEMGEHDLAQDLIEQHETLEELARSDRKEARQEAKRLLGEELISGLDMSDPDALRTASLTASAQGNQELSRQLQSASDALVDLQDFTVVNAGDHYRLINNFTGEEMDRVPINVSPDTLAQIAAQQQGDVQATIRETQNDYIQRQQNEDIPVRFRAYENTQTLREQWEAEGGLPSSVVARQVVSNLYLMNNPGRQPQEVSMQELLKSGGIRGAQARRIQGVMDGREDRAVVEEIFDLVDQMGRREAQRLEDIAGTYRRRLQDQGIDPAYIENPWRDNHPHLFDAPSETPEIDDRLDDADTRQDILRGYDNIQDFMPGRGGF